MHQHVHWRLVGMLFLTVIAANVLNLAEHGLFQGQRTGELEKIESVGKSGSIVPVMPVPVPVPVRA